MAHRIAKTEAPPVLYSAVLAGMAMWFYGLAGLQVRLFARGDVASKEWVCFADLAEDLASYVQATNWAVRLMIHPPFSTC